MHTSFERSATRLSAIKGLSAERWLSLLFAGWLVLSVTTPEDVYRTFFHALIYPLTVFLLVRAEGDALRNDAFVRLFLVFCGYMAITTWVVGTGPVEDDIQATRWGFEAALGMAAFYLWMRSVVSRGVFWGRWFLLMALLGAVAGMLSSLNGIVAGARIGGLGAMEQPIQGPSIAIVFLAVGLFLTFRRHRASSRADLVVGIVSVVAVSVFVTLTQSRAPLITLVLYLLFFATVQYLQRQRAVAIYAVVLVLGSVAALIHWLTGLDVFFEHLIARGASYRLDIWTAYLTYLPESVMLGNGAGMNFDLTDASRLYLEPMGLDISHPHNLWLGAFVETGLIGLLMQGALVILPVVAAFRSRCPATDKLHLLAIVGLFLMLTFSDEYTLLISLHPIWFFGWVPLVFVWVWSTRERPLKDPGGRNRSNQEPREP